MTRKDYELIARALREQRETAMTLARETQASPKLASAHRSHRTGIELAAHGIAEALAKENQRFNVERFLKACGVQS